MLTIIGLGKRLAKQPGEQLTAATRGPRHERSWPASTPTRACRLADTTRRRSSSCRACSGELDRPVYIKRDDQIGPGMGGNKTRKLEYLLAEAQPRGAP